MTLSPNDLDLLMDKDPLSLTRDDLDAIVAYHRNNRERAEGRPKKETVAGPTIDIAAIGLKPAAPKFNRRF